MKMLLIIPLGVVVAFLLIAFFGIFQFCHEISEAKYYIDHPPHPNQPAST